MLLIHGFSDRLRDADSIAYQGVPSPSRRASQARAYRQSRFKVLTDTPITLGRFLDAQPGVIAELDDLGETRVFRVELLDRLVEGEQIAARRFDPGQALGQLDPLRLPSVFETGLVAGLFDEDLAHRLRGRAEEMAPAFPAGILVPHQPEIRLVDQGRRLEGLAGAQPGRQRRGQPAQLVVENRQQFRRRLLRFGWILFIGLRHEKKISEV